MDQGTLKKMAADAAVEYVRDGQILGVGTGSTVRYVVAELAERIKKGLRIQGVATSLETARLAHEAGIPLLADDAEWVVDLALDGADQVDPRLNLIKGGGGALLKEKIVAAAATRFVVVVDETKRVPVLGGAFPLPAEVVPFGWRPSSPRPRSGRGGWRSGMPSWRPASPSACRLATSAGSGRGPASRRATTSRSAPAGLTRITAGNSRSS